MNEKLEFAFLLLCIIALAISIILSIRLVIMGGRISKLEGEMDSLLIYLKSKKDEGGNADGNP